MTRPADEGRTTHSTPTDDGPRFPRVVWLAALTVLMAQFPITLVSVSLTKIARAAQLAGSQLQWIQATFSLAMAATVLSAGAIAEKFGRKRIMLIGLAMMGGAAILGGFSALFGPATYAVLIIAQAIGGAGAGALLPTTLAEITTAVSRRNRGPAVALWGAGTTLGLAVGAVIAGLIDTSLPWGFIYLPAAVVAFGILIAVQVMVTESETSHTPLDIAGQVLAALAIVAVIFGAIEGGSLGWGSPLSWGPFAAFVVLAVAFVLRELHHEAPLMDPLIFRNPRFVAAALAAAVALYSVVGTGFIVPLFLGSTLHLSPMQIAYATATTPFLGFLAAPLVARLMSVLHATTVLIMALVLAAIGLWTVSGIGAMQPGASTWNMAWRLAIFGVGVAMMLSSVATVAVDAVVPREIPMAGATNTTIRQIGGALGPAVTGAVYLANVGAGATQGAAFTATLHVNAFVLLAAAVVTVIANLFPRPAEQG